MKYKSVKGMEDILPQDVQVWQELERVARIVIESYGYKEIRTPLLEDTSIFVRSIGETTDIVTKEMYTFEDRKGRSLTLRPEGTAPMVRAYIEHSLDKALPDPARLYYIGPMFRSERPQKGRSRQFHQIGVEIIGSNDAFDDAELILLLDRMLRQFGLLSFTIKLNSLGCKKDKEEFEKRLKEYLKDKKGMLCDDCKNRVEKNVLRVLDCKNEKCIDTVKNAPSISDFICNKCGLDFTLVKTLLQYNNVSFAETKNLVRGLDYYTGTVFEIAHPRLGGQDALGAGGRYDNLVKDLGGHDVGAVGFGIGIERVLLALGDKKVVYMPEVIFFAALGKEAKKQCLSYADELRKIANDDPLKVKTVVRVGLSEASLKSQMRNAGNVGAKFVVIVGEDEIKKGEATVRNMSTKEQFQVKFEDLIQRLNKLLQ